MFLNFWNKLIFSNFHIDTVYKENHQPIFAIAFSHLTHSANVFPEQQFHVGLVVGGRQGKETVEHILGKSDQLLRRTERRLELMGLIIVICLFVTCKNNLSPWKTPKLYKAITGILPTNDAGHSSHLQHRQWSALYLAFLYLCYEPTL